MRGFVRLCRFHNYRHKARHRVRQQREAAILGRPDPVRKLLRNQIMPSRHVRNYCTQRNRLGNDPPFLLIAPPLAANYARYFRTAPNNVRVVNNVDHNVHTIPTESPSCTTRTQSPTWGESTAYVSSSHGSNDPPIPYSIIRCLSEAGIQPSSVRARPQSKTAFCVRDSQSR